MGDRWIFADPDGNAFWMVAAFDVNETDSKLPTGTTYDAAVKAKYGSSNRSVWGKQTILRLRNWGFNTVAEYASLYVLPFSQYPPGSTSASGEYMPAVMLMRPSYYGLTDEGRYAPGPFKNLEDCLDGAYTGYKSDGPPDVFDPNFSAYVTGFLRSRVARGAPWYQVVTSRWVIGVAVDDADSLQGFGPGAEVQSLDQVVHVHIGWLALAVSPTKSSSTKYHATYSDPTVYTKKALHDFLEQKYSGSIAALNAEWGSNYSTFESDGGWGTGTGLTDEDGRHTAWLGTSDGTLHNAKAGVVADLDAFLYQYAVKYFSITAGGVREYVPNHLVFGPASLNGHGGLTRKQVLEAAGQYLDVLNAGIANQRVLDLTARYFGDKPIVAYEIGSANPDSDLSAYPNSISFRGSATQEARGQYYRNHVNFDFDTATSAGVHPIAGLKWWAWLDSWGEKGNWGLVSFLDNAYDGKEAVTAPGKDAWGYPTGGEARNYGDFLSAVTKSNADVIQRLFHDLSEATRDTN